MSNLKPTTAVEEWNSLNKENTEQSFVSSMFQSMTETTSVIDKFSTWLLAGSGATGALLITQIDSVIPNLTEIGFRLCLVIIALSAIFGFIAKYYSLRCEIQNKTQVKMLELITPILEKHYQDEVTIKDFATKEGLQLDTQVDFHLIIVEFSRPFPKLIQWLIKRKLDKVGMDRQAGFHIAAKVYMLQILWTFLQASMFLIFLLTGAWFASGII